MTEVKLRLEAEQCGRRYWMSTRDNDALGSTGDDNAMTGRSSWRLKRGKRGRKMGEPWEGNAESDESQDLTSDVVCDSVICLGEVPIFVTRGGKCPPYLLLDGYISVGAHPTGGDCHP
ncbi:hypothetical protein PIB30_100383 [Stylosanthes scabra]|uniref:Uncharacterized protein n=1 Tax=Stylosanthes scabra TaxID=79078 RepID=A0ABU6ZVX6_9FABA|nr:hypothetical protein [Stylosanthes scabra]